MAFHVGQKVVCITWEKWTWSGHNVEINGRCPAFKCIYTVSHSNMYINGNKFIALVEFPRNGNQPWGWNVKYFRPVVSRETDISIFKEILRNPKVGIQETEETV